MLGVYPSEEAFIQDLKMMWFGLYSRNNNKLDSSGFEHIFAGLWAIFCFSCLSDVFIKTFSNFTGEIKGGKVSGFHNWIQFYLLEKRGQLNYYSHSFNGPVSVRGAGLMAKCCAFPSFSSSLSNLLSVDNLPWRAGDAVHVGRLLQAGRFCHHGLQPWVRPCPVQPVLHRPPRKTVSIPTIPVTFSHCHLSGNALGSAGVVWASEGRSSLSRPTSGTTPPTEMGKSSLARPFLPPPGPCKGRLNVC